MKILLEYLDGGMANIRMDESAHHPLPKQIAVLGKALGNHLANYSELNDFEMVSLFKIAYASMLDEFARNRGLEMSELMEAETSAFAIRKTNEMKVEKVTPSDSGSGGSDLLYLPKSSFSKFDEKPDFDRNNPDVPETEDEDPD